MGRADLLQTNFSGGELSPRLYGRPDLAKYNDAVKRARDVILLQHGGATRRPCTVFVGEVKNSSDLTRLIPFVFSRTDAYLLEHGHTVLRFWKNGALLGGPYEISSPYSSTDIMSVDYTQGADTMFLALQSVTPRRLRRFADTRWVLDHAPIDPVPFDETGMRQATAIALGSAAVGATTATAAGATWLASDVGRKLSHNGGIATVTGLVSALVANVTVSEAFASVNLPASEWVLEGSPQTTCTASAKDPVGASVTLMLGADGWRTADVGKHVQINGGLCRITGFTDAQNVTAEIKAELTSVTAAPANAWSLEGPVWNSIDGHPRTVTLHEQRAVYAGTPKHPQKFWGSRSGLYFDFTKGPLDDDSYSFELGSDEINPIQFLSSNRDLIALTYGGEWTISGGIEKPITPSNVRAKPQAKAGAASVRPEQVDDDLYYIQRGLSAVRTLGFQVDMGGYQSGEASTLSEHLAKGGINSVSYAQSPERVLWHLKDDGTLLACTVSREQSVRAFSLCTLQDGFIESIATIPEDGEDKTYLIVRRTINGATKRYVERLEWDCHLDCAITLAPAGSLVTGLSHLAGEVVGVVADGVDLGDFTVSAGGEVTLTRDATTVTVGKRNTPTLRLLPPEFGTGMGAAMGKSVHNGKTFALFQETIGCNVNGQPLAFREFGEDVLDAPVEAYSGWKKVSDQGWGVDAGEVELTQPQAYPWSVLAVVRRMTANPG